MQIDLHASTSHVRACTPHCKPAQGKCTPGRPSASLHAIRSIMFAVTYGNARGATSLARGCLRSTVRSSLPDGGLFSPRTKLPMSICDLLISNHECCTNRYASGNFFVRLLQMGPLRMQSLR